MVKEFDPGFTSEVWTLIDLQEAVQARYGNDTTDELAVTVAASVTRRLLNQRLPMGLAASGERLSLVPPDRTEEHFGRVLEVLARSQAAGRLPLREAIALLEPRLSRYATLLVVTPWLDPSWVKALQPLRRRDVRLVAIVIDASSFGGPGDPASVLSALAETDVPAYLVRRGDDLSRVLASPHLPQGRGAATTLGTGARSQKEEVVV